MKFVGAVALLTLAAFAFAGPAAAAEGPGAALESAAAPQIVHVGFYVLSSGKLDVGTGTFSVDFYLSLKSDAPVPESFEFMNGRAANMDKIIDKPNEKFYRILANLASPIDFKRFPFDAQRLQVIIEDKRKTAAELIFVPDNDESGFDPSVSFPGWELTGWAPTVNEHEYAVYGESFSQYAFNIGIARIKSNSFIKTFLPVLFLMLIMVSSFILNPDQVVTRLATISSALVASAMFHISIASQIPPVGYLTFADKFMLLTYFALLLSFFLNIVIFLLQGRDKKDAAARFNAWCKGLVFVCVPILYLALFLVFA